MEFDVSVKPSGIDELDGKLFSIDESSFFIFELLRSKMYQDPISAICREISCNARDANRAAGKGNIPIEVKLPTKNYKYFEVSDCGNGISPEIVDNVFIKYAASTKRSDNVQTGGFGLGAKTPFAYADSFNVITVCNGIRYQYVCYIDDTKIGKMSLLDSHETSDPSGTKIIIKINDSDILKFQSAFNDAVKYWDVKPISNIEIQNISIQTDLVDSFISYDKYNYGQFITYALIDGICYPVDLGKLRKSPLTKYKLYLKFNNGELSITPNREVIHYDNKTINLLSERINKADKDLYEYFKNKISLSNTFFDAILLKKNFESISYPKDFQWKGFNVPSENSIYLGSNIAEINITNKNGRKYKRLSFSRYLNYNSNIYFNDLKLSSDVIENGLSQICKNMTDSFSIIVDEDISALKEKIPYDFLDIKNLSSITKVPKQKKSKTIIYKFSEASFSRVSNSSIDNDQNVKIFIELDRYKNAKTNLLSTYEINNFGKEYSFYGLIEPSEDDLEIVEDFIKINDFIEFLVLENKDKIIKYELEKNKENAFHSTHWFLKEHVENLNKLLKYENKYLNTLFNSKMDCHNAKYDFYLKLYYRLGNASAKVNDDSDIKDLKIKQQEFLDENPMLKWVNFSSYNSEDRLEDVAKYIDDQFEKRNNYFLTNIKQST